MIGLRRFRVALMPLLLVGLMVGGAISSLAGWRGGRGATALSHQASSVVEVTNATVRADGVYTDKEGIASYIVSYGRLPGNFITKAEARRLGWQGGPLEPYAPGKSIGGDRFGNYEHVLPQGNYRECDVDTLRRPRGAKRIVYTTDRHVYYSEDHYRTFKRIR